ncbi:Nitrilase/cyanide hydratase and apolipoprotein N-acyltransferase, partial [Reticulomyxa filosa]
MSSIGPLEEKEIKVAETDIKSVKVAAIQAPNYFGNIEKNKIHFTNLIRQAADKGAKIIVLPEAALTGYASVDFKKTWFIRGRDKWTDSKRFDSLINPLEYAQDKDDSSMIKHFQTLCRELSIYCTIPFVEKVKSPPQKNKE